MNERPLSERPAARPITLNAAPTSDASPPAVASPVVPPKANFLSKLGCGGWAAIIFMAILVISVVGSIVETTDKNARMSSGSVTYDVKPKNVDPRTTFDISAKCDAIMAASASDVTDKGEALLVQSGNICRSRAEWEAALYKYPGAIGGSSTAYLDGSEFGTLCSLHPEVLICRKP